MSGLELFARDSRSRLEKNAEAVAVFFSDVYSRDDDERNWSFSYLKEQLLLKNSQTLFRRYQVRVQHALFVELLAFNLVYNSLSLLAYIFFPDMEQLSEVSAGAIQTGRVCRSVSLVCHLAVFVAAYKESLFRSASSKIAAACLILFCMILGEMGSTIYRFSRGFPEVTIHHTFYIVLTTTVLLPFPRKLYSGISAASVITLDLMLDSIGSIGIKNKFIVMCADVVFFATILAVGLGIRYLIEIMNRRAFLDRRETLESKIKTETEKNQEEKFLQSILPSHIAEEVRDDIRDVMKDADRLHIHHKPFNKLYVERHKDVSILYADIVNSMLLAASLNVSDLVETLNDLFGRFDHSAEKNNCMRIKLLGDCYYCVSGITNRDDRHADNCVLTGLKMIDIIRCVREKRSINVDMRIGIHTGNVLGGLLGLRKWQFDVWSKDVTIASHMEQAGIPGHVHITKTTKDHLQDDAYDIQPGDGYLRDSYLQNEGIETYLISSIRRSQDPHDNRLDSPDIIKGLERPQFQRQVSASRGSNIARLSNRQSSNDTFTPMSRRGALGYSLHQYRKMVGQVNDILEKSIDKMALSKKDQWFSNVGIQPLLLTFREKGREKPYLNQPDPLFKYYLLCMIAIFCGITIIHLLILSRTLEFWICYGITLLLILGAFIPSWAGYIWLSLKADDSDVMLNSTVLKISRKVWKTTSIRVIMWLAISTMILFCSIAGLNECLDVGLFDMLKGGNASATDNTTSLNYADSCGYPWFYTLCAALAMTTTTVFLRIHYLMKLALNSSALGIFWYIMDIRGEEVFRQQRAKFSDWEEFGFPVDQSHCFYLAFVVCILHIVDRQVEYVCRLDFLMKVQLKAEQEEASSIEVLNRMLLYNILPPHVAKFYLSKQLDDDSEKVEVATYHEECSSVAVLFASIPKFADFYYEDDENEEGLRCIQLLNEIICDFDMLLYQTQFGCIEKIKTIGSTFMAACGLHSQKEEQICSEMSDDPAMNVLVLAKFAVSMMSSLHQLNKDAMQDFQLRVGISVGPVMAGVVGTVKPQYDIWGDTVNVASRMDSTGIAGRIQVTEEVAYLLSTVNCPYESECRGEIFVKGKGNLTTYFLQTPFDEPPFQVTKL
ncbi:adenylate cyclase type 2-like [Uloborus diversus]|uniref:adenylate cyclase type 2-like n=1 Tax=Uloborus diversus TaxID=327109 RepID=UPI00240A5ED6|nr:adenylate cyclase type 2-like [Uloborus diversus]